MSGLEQRQIVDFLLRQKEKKPWLIMLNRGNSIRNADVLRKNYLFVLGRLHFHRGNQRPMVKGYGLKINFKGSTSIEDRSRVEAKSLN